MDLALAVVAEQLAQEFADLPAGTVVREVTASADQAPGRVRARGWIAESEPGPPYDD